MSSLYGKLSVNRRSAALAAARSMHFSGRVHPNRATLVRVAGHHDGAHEQPCRPGDAERTGAAALRALAEHWGPWSRPTTDSSRSASGIALLVWLHASVTVFAVLLAIQLIVVGIVRIVQAVSIDRREGAARALIGLLGASPRSSGC